MAAIIPVFVILAVVPASAGLQYWQALSFSFPLARKISGTLLMPQVRMTEGADEVYAVYMGGGASYAVTGDLGLAVQMFCIPTRQEDDEFLNENRLVMDVKFKKKVFKFSAGYRFRYDLRDKPSCTEHRYRNQLSLSLPVKITSRRFSPYVSEEIFYSSSVASLNQNRLTIGIRSGICSLAEIDIFGILRSDKAANGWEHTGIAGSTLTFFLGSEDKR